MRQKFKTIHVGTTSLGLKVEIMDCSATVTEFLNRFRNKPVKPIICLSGLSIASALGAWAHIEVEAIDELCELLKEAKRRCLEISKCEEK